jgi:LysM repeat protein
MIIRRIIILVGSVVLFLSGCNTAEIKQEQASQRADIQDLQDRLGKLQSDMVSVQSENDALKTQIANLKEDLSASRESNEQYQKDIARLDDLVKRLDTAREQDRKIIVDEVSQEISRLSKKVQAASAPAPQPAPVTEEGVEHVVAKGETLNAIAKAYGVTAKQIQDANKLSSTSLKIGQKLFIPQKSKSSSSKPARD